MSTGEAKTKIVIDVGEGAKSIRQLKQEFKDTQKGLEDLTVGTKAYTDQLKKLGGIKDEMEDLKTSINNFHPEKKLQVLIGVGQGIASGFQAATAASALFGGEAQEVEKAMLKVQASMALANSIQEFGTIREKIQQAGVALKAMIGASGIGVLVLAVGAIAANWDKIKSAMTGVTKEQEKAVEAAKAATVEGQKKIDHLGIEEKQMRLRGATEQQILATKQKAYIVQQGLLKAELEQALKLGIQQEQAADRNKEILKGILKFSTAPLQALIDGIDYIAEKVNGKKLIDVDLSDKLANTIFDPKEAADRVKALQDTYKKNAEALVNQELDLQLQLKSVKDAAYKKEQDDLKAAGEERFRIAKEQADRAAAEEAANAKWEAEQRAKEKAEKDATDDEQAAADAAKLNQSLLSYQQTKEKEIQTAKDAAERKKLIQEAEFAVAQSAMSSLQSLAQIAGVEGEEMIGIQKGLALTQIAIDTAKAISAVVAASAANPSNAATFGVAGVIQMATGIATVLANIAAAKRILDSESTPSSISVGGGGGGGGGARPPVINPVGNTSTNLANINNPQTPQKPIKVYVTETDSTAAQKRISKIEDKTKF